MLIYLAGAYSHPDVDVVERRWIAHCAAAGKLMAANQTVFSPIAHSHPIAMHAELDHLDGEFWLRQDFAILNFADVLVVLTEEDYRTSKGTMAEIREAGELGIPVLFWDGVDAQELLSRI